MLLFIASRSHRLRFLVPPFKQRWLLETAKLIHFLFESSNVSERLLPLGIMFLGTVTEVLMEKDISELCFSVLASLLRYQPALIMQSRFLAIILYGYSSLLVNVNVDELVEILRMLIEVWALQSSPAEQSSQPASADSTHEMQAFLTEKAASKDPPIDPESSQRDTVMSAPLVPSLEEQIRYLHLFSTVYNGRKAKSEERMAYAKRALVMRKQLLASKRRPQQADLAPLPTVDQVRDQEDEWLIASSQVLEAQFMTAQSAPAVRFMALFAGMGIFKEMMRPEDANPTNIHPREAYESFNSMITSAVMRNLSGSNNKSSDPLSRSWRRAVAVICVNIDKSLPWIRDDILLELVVDVLLDDILSLDWLTVSPPHSLPELMQRIEQHKQQGIYRMANVFVRAASVLFQHSSSESLRSAIMVRLASFSQRLFMQWREFLMSPAANLPLPANMEPNHSGAERATGAAALESAMKPVLNTVFLSIAVFSKLVHKGLTCPYSSLRSPALQKWFLRSLSV